MRKPAIYANPMRFTLIDRIVDLQLNQSITAVKNLSLAEEYLADHFPCFPVMPGVLMLEAMTQVAAWLVRASEDFAHSMVVLSEAKSVKYGQFVEPGQSLFVTAKIIDQTKHKTKIKAAGIMENRQVVSARLVLHSYNLGDKDPLRKATDSEVIQSMRDLFQLLYRPGLSETGL